MQEYEHTQPGILLRWIFGSAAAFPVGIAILVSCENPSSAAIPLVATGILVSCLLLFHSLTVNVSRGLITLRFGVGLIGKRFVLADVERSTAVRNRWYYGWGIKLTPHGWLYNVSGLDAVEIELRNGRTYRIGTDQPAELQEAIKSARVGCASIATCAD